MSDFNSNNDKELSNEAVDANECRCNKKNKFTKDIVDYIEIFVFAICFVMLIFSFLFRVCTVEGPSMNSTLIEGEDLIVSDLFYTPKRGDIIVFHDTNTLNKPVVKRVIATEGEKISISYTDDTMIVKITSVDGDVNVLEEPYITYSHQTYPSISNEVVPQGTVFVMGDNRSDSMDSRDNDIGFVDTRSILGRVIFRISPFSRIGVVD